ncbi:MAG TPA: DNA internalization-related competence protein ComEC/Rec2 [Povalibacter sp.]|nr:DNA internalization-related competence protein ComEC/Rec2 [Povalibacter sp.]
MLRTGIAFLLGDGLIQLLPHLPSVQPWGWLLGAAVLLLLVLRSATGVAFVLGLLLAWSSAAARLADDLPTALEGVDLCVRGYVASLSDTTATEPQFEFDVAHGDSGVPSRLRLGWYDGIERPQPGELWQLVVRLKRRSGFANPGGFDYEAQLLRQGIGATGYVREDSRNVRLAGPASRYAVLRVRAWLAARLALALHDDPMLGVMQGLAVGQTSAMTADQWRVLAATGTTHLMAISGLHITMIAALAAWLGGNIARWRGAQRWRLTAIHGQVLCGGFAAVGYSALAGLSVPTQRTLAMLCIAFAVRALAREFSVGNALGLALIAVLLVDPFAPLAVGAWLSFGAVAAILLAAAGRRASEGVIRRFTRTQFAVTVGLMPILLGAFGSVSLVSPVANAAAVPLFTLAVVPLVLLGTVLSAIWLPAGAAVLQVPALLLHWFWPVLQWLSRLPLAQWHFPQLPLGVHVALGLGALLLLLPGITATRLTAAALCLPALLWRPQLPATGEFRLAMLDVGQGLAVVVQTRRHVLVYDAGPAFRSGRDTGELVVVPYLHSQGVRAVDMLMISHGDMDHRGGMRSILQSLPVQQILVGPSVPVAALHSAALCTRGETWMWDGVAFEVLHPGATQYARDNDSSCVLRIRGTGGSALLTGDIQSDGESALAATGLGQTDIVIAPHHGSRTSSTRSLVDATRPGLVLFSTGYRNRWGFPRPDVVTRWRHGGAQTLATAQSGAIIVDVSAGGLRPPQQFRVDYPHYWRTR